MIRIRFWKTAARTMLFASGISFFGLTSFAQQMPGGPSSLAQERSAAASPAVHSNMPEASTEDGNLLLSQDENGALYLDFKGASLLNVLSALSEISKINFVAGTEIAKREVNMSLDGVSLQQVLQALSNGSNVTYSYMPESNIIMFRASSDAAQLAPLYTRVFKLYYLRATPIQEINAGSSSGGGGGGGLSVVSGGSSGGGGSGGGSGGGGQSEVSILKVLEKMTSERGAVGTDERSNSLIVTDTEDRLQRMAAVIADLDRPLSQVLISVILIETFEDLNHQLGVEWGGDSGTLASFTGANKPTIFPFGPNHFRGDDGHDNFPGNLFDNYFSFDGREPTTRTFDLDGNLLIGSTTITTGTQNFSDFSQRVKALQTATKLRVLAKPNILVMDNHPAIVKIVTNAAIGQAEVSTSTGSGAASATTSNSAERAEIGTILRVTPQINTQDQITLTIEPTFSTLGASGIVVQTTGQTGDPTVRAARTTLMVKSGGTLVMGGLMFSNQTDGERKLPFFGDLPLIGKAFKSNAKSVEDRELVLFLSPQIIKNTSSLTPRSIPKKEDNYEDEKAEFWKYKKKNWYKKIQKGSAEPNPAVPYEEYFQVRETAMDKMVGDMSADKVKQMQDDVKKAGQDTDLKWEDPTPTKQS